MRREVFTFVSGPVLHRLGESLQYFSTQTFCSGWEYLRRGLGSLWYSSP